MNQLTPRSLGKRYALWGSNSNRFDPYTFASTEDAVLFTFIEWCCVFNISPVLCYTWNAWTYCAGNSAKTDLCVVIQSKASLHSDSKCWTLFQILSHINIFKTGWLPQMPYFHDSLSGSDLHSSLHATSTTRRMRTLQLLTSEDPIASDDGWNQAQYMAFLPSYALHF